MATISPLTRTNVHFQQTLGRSVSVAGTGVHGGRPVRVTLRPSAGAAAGSPRRGITFRRVDLEAAAGCEIQIPATLESVSRTDHATTLSAQTSAGLVSVQTVEHLIAALAGLGIDACTVEVDGPEVPILDGSSAPWVALLRSAGRRSTSTPRRVLRIVRPFTAEFGAASVAALPSHESRVTCAIDFAHPAIGFQEITVRLDLETGDAFERELAGARTFGFLRDVEQLRAAGLARGASRDNAIVLDDDGPLDPLRWPDEYVRHKALDLVGDLALLGMPFVGHVVARRAGHRLHAEFARQLIAATECWRIETLRPAQDAAPAVVASRPMAMPVASAD